MNSNYIMEHDIVHKALGSKSGEKCYVAGWLLSYTKC